MIERATPTGNACLDGRARLLPLPRAVDERGALTPLEFRDLPFQPQRVFTVSDVPAGALRGGHGHWRGEQLLVCIEGRITLRLVAGGQSDTVALHPGGPGLLLGPGVWAEQHYDVPGSVLLVVASDPYDPGSYFTDEYAGP
jgi:hypothetical protein